MKDIIVDHTYTDSEGRSYRVLNIAELSLIDERYVIYKQGMSSQIFAESMVKFRRRIHGNECNKTGIPSDNVSHPAHYCFGKYEPKDVIRDWHLNFNRGSALKYIARAGKKNDEIEDLQKAIQCLKFEIEYLEKERDGNSCI